MSKFTGGISKPALAPKPEPLLPDVTIAPDYKLATITLVLSGLLDTVPWIQLTLGPLITALGVLFLVQTTRIRFTFDKVLSYMDGMASKLMHLHIHVTATSFHFHHVHTNATHCCLKRRLCVFVC